MNGNWKYIESNINEYPEYRSAIFEQGFFLTDRELELKVFPFYDYWTKQQLNKDVFLYTHKNQKAYIYEKDNKVYVLIGHAYDPFDFEWDENNILKRISDISNGDFSMAIPMINQLTGLFLFGIFPEESFVLCGDFESMRTAYYGKINDYWYVTSHEEIVAFLEPLTIDEYVTQLENYRWYHLYGEGLPGDISHYRELKKNYL